MIFYTVYVICAAAFGLADKLTLPVTTCKRLSPDYFNCLKTATQEAWPRFTKGLPEFDFPPMDPLFYENEKITFGKLDAEVNLLNVTVFGLRNVRFDAVTPHLHNDVFNLQIDIFKEQLKFFSTVVFNGTLGSVQIHRKGFCKVINTNFTETWIITGRVTNDTWLVENFDTIILDGNVNAHCIGLFPNEIMNYLFNKFVSDNFVNLYQMIPNFNKLLSSYVIDLGKRFLSKVPFSVLFP